MDLFMPSEIARLVLGYLKEAGCVETTTVYMRENPHLSEYVSCLKQGYEYPTTIGGKTLVGLLNELSSLRTGVQNAKNDTQMTEMKEILKRIDERISDLKDLAKKTLLRPITSESDAEIRIQTQRITDRILNMGSENSQKTSENAESLVIESLSNNLTSFVSNEPQIRSATIDLPSTSSKVVVSTSASRFSTSTLCPSLLCTPTSSPPELYSSPSSIARSALLFSFGADALQTPNKDTDLAEDGSWKSPRRKSQPTRKRLSYSPSPTAKKKRVDRDEIVSFEETDLDPSKNDSVGISVFIGQLLNNTLLHERIAANINRVVSNLNQVDGSDDKELESEEKRTTPKKSEARETETPSETHVSDRVIKDIVHQTQSDPLFDDFLTFFLEKNQSNSEEITDSEEVPSLESLDTDGTSDLPIAETPMSVCADVVSLPCDISNDICPNTDTEVEKTRQNASLAPVMGGFSSPVSTSRSKEESNCFDKESSVDSVSQQKAVSPRLAATKQTSSPSKVSKLITDVNSLLSVTNSPKQTVSTMTPLDNRSISDVSQSASVVELDSEVAVSPVPIANNVEGSCSVLEPQTVTYTLLEPITVGSILELPSIMNNRTTVIVQAVQLQETDTSTLTKSNPVSIAPASSASMSNLSTNLALKPFPTPVSIAPASMPVLIAPASSVSVSNLSTSSALKSFRTPVSITPASMPVLIAPAPSVPVSNLSTTRVLKPYAIPISIVPASSAPISTIPALKSFPATSEIEIMSLSPAQLLSMGGKNVTKVDNTNETIHKVEDFERILENNQRKQQSLRPLRPNQRFVRLNEALYRNRLLQIEENRKVSILKPVSERRTVDTQETSLGSNYSSKLRSSKLVSLLESAKTFKPLDVNANSNNIRVMTFNTAAKSKSPLRKNKTGSAEQNDETDVVTVSKVSETTSEMDKSPSKRKNGETEAQSMAEDLSSPLKVNKTPKKTMKSPLKHKNSEKEVQSTTEDQSDVSKVNKTPSKRKNGKRDSELTTVEKKSSTKQKTKKAENETTEARKSTKQTSSSKKDGKKPQSVESNLDIGYFLTRLRYAE